MRKKITSCPIDVQSKLTEILSREIADSIDKEIINSLGIYLKKDKSSQRINKIRKIFKF